MPNSSLPLTGPLRVPATKAPSFFNRDAMTGAIIGTWLFPGIGSVIGAVLGSRQGHSRMEREQVEGKLVGQPTAWNRTLLWGAAIGGTIAFGVTIAIVAGMVLPELLAAKAITDVVMAAATAKVLPIWPALSLLPTLGTLIGAKMGSSAGKRDMARERAEAEAYVRQYGEYQGRTLQAALQAPTPEPSRAPTISYKHSVSPEESAALHERIAARAAHSAVQRLEEQQPSMSAGLAQR